MPAAGIVLVELGFERNALLSKDDLADSHGIAKVGGDRDGLPAAWQRIVVALKGALERANGVDKLGARIGTSQRRTVWRAKAALEYTGHGGVDDGFAAGVCGDVALGVVAKSEVCWAKDAVVICILGKAASQLHGQSVRGSRRLQA